MILLLSLVTVLAWGTWLYPTRLAGPVPQSAVTLYATLGNLVVTLLIVLLGSERGLPATADTLAAMGAGAMWAAGGYCAFSATRALGPATAMAIWSPLNILVTVIGGAALLHEWSGLPSSVAATRLGALALMGTGLLIVVRSMPRSSESDTNPKRRGIGFAIGAGLLWAAYVFPIRLQEIATRDAVLPMALGMTLGASMICLVQKTPLRLSSPRAYGALLGCGVLWSAGNYASLALMERIGVGPGFAVAQLCLVVNSLTGVWFLREPAPSSPQAKRLLTGSAAAVVAGALLGWTLTAAK